MSIAPLSTDTHGKDWLAQRHPSAAGFTLIEILIALVIFSIGLLGLAGMQLRGSEGTNMAYQRSQATLIATDMAERMHANKAGILAGDYATMNTHADAAAACANVPALICATRGGVIGARCNANQMATFDLYTAACNTDTLLPDGGNVTVVCNDADLTDADPCTPGSPHTVTVTWNEVRDGQAVPSDVTLEVLP